MKWFGYIFVLFVSNLLFLGSSLAVVDFTTSLDWQQSDDGTLRTWDEALDYCDNLGSNWRVPNIRELDSLVDLEKTDPAINTAFDSQSGNYWTSTSYAADPASAWMIHFFSGDDSTSNKDNIHYVRCVQGGLTGPWYEPPTVVADLDTGLEWQQASEKTQYTWQEGLNYCENLVLTGLDTNDYADWRLPNIRELDSLVDLTRSSPAIDPELQIQMGSYWTATTYAHGTASAWTINFITGDDSTTNKTGTSFVRCVRSTEPGIIYEPPLTVIDLKTSLEWQQSGDGLIKEWQEALSYCQGLPLDGQFDWRLPDIRELDSLVDLNRTYPAINPAFQTEIGSYWTSTTYAAGTASAWKINFITGDDGTGTKTGSNYARCVRDVGTSYVYRPEPVVEEPKTDLEWMQGDDGVVRSWEAGLLYCETLTYNSKRDWRMPNIRELDSLVDLNRTYPAIDPAYQTQVSDYWSSTSYAADTASAWKINFTTGDDGTDSKGSANYIRCVRSGRSGPFDDQNPSEFGLNMDLMDDIAKMIAQLEHFQYAMESFRMDDKLSELSKVVTDVDELKANIQDLFTQENLVKGLLTLKFTRYKMGKFYDFIKKMIQEDNELIFTATDYGLHVALNGRGFIAENLSLSRFDQISFSRNGSQLEGVFKKDGSDTVVTFEPYINLVNSESGIITTTTINAFTFKNTSFFSIQDGVGALTEVTFSHNNWLLTIISNPFLTSLKRSSVKVSADMGLDLSAFVGVGGGISYNAGIAYNIPEDTYHSYGEAWQDLRNSSSCLADCFSNTGSGSALEYMSVALTGLIDSACYASCLGHEPSVELEANLSGKVGIGAGGEVVEGVTIYLTGKLAGGVKIDMPIDETRFLTSEVQQKIARFLLITADLFGRFSNLPIHMTSIGSIKAIVRKYMEARSLAKELDNTLSANFKNNATISLAGSGGLEAAAKEFASISGDVALGGDISITMQNYFDLFLFRLNTFKDTADISLKVGRSIRIDLGAGPVGFGASYANNIVSVRVQHNGGTKALPLSGMSFPMSVSTLVFTTESTQDTDSNGQHDSLTIDGTMTADEAASYTVYGSLFSELDCVAVTTQELDQPIGSNPISLIFDSLQIINSGKDGPYQLNVTIFQDGLEDPVFDQDGIYLTGSYLATDFQGGVMHVDNMLFSGVDTNSDGLFEVLQAEVTVIVDETLEFTLKGKGGNGLVLTAETQGSLVIGSNQVTIQFDGEEIRKQGLDGPYSFSFQLLDTQGELHDSLDADATGFLAADFQAPALSLTDIYGNQTIDRNSNGLYDELQFTVGILVTQSGYYSVEATINSENGRYFISRKLYLTPNDSVIRLPMDGRKIRQTGRDQTYILSYLSLSDSYGINYGTRVTPHTTGVYNFSDFELEQITLAETYSAQGIDTNGNGLFDLLRLLVEVNVNEAGLYRFIARIDCGDRLESTEAAIFLEPGNHSVQLDFSTDDIFQFGANGTCTLERVAIIGEDEEYFDSENGTVQTYEYDYLNFDKPCNDDFNGDGVIDLIDVIIGLNILSDQWPNELSNGDCNNDGVIGMAEILHVIKTVSQEVE